MTVKVIYLNGCWEYVRGVKSVSADGGYFLVELENGSTLEFDRRLKLEISYY